MTRLYSKSFVLENFRSKKAEGSEEWIGQTMYTHSGGYKFCIRIHPNGYEDLEWPVEVQFTMEMLNSVGGSNWIVISDTGWWGKNRKSYLLSIDYSEKQNCYIEHSRPYHYLCDDCLYFKVSCYVYDW